VYWWVLCFDGGVPNIEITDNRTNKAKALYDYLDLPELEPKLTSTIRHQGGHFEPSRDCIIFKIWSGITPRTPPPSIVIARTAAVGGSRRMVTSTVRPQRVPELKWYTDSPFGVGLPKRRTQRSHNEWSQRSRYCDRCIKHKRHVLYEEIPFQVGR